jgi:hypothetical protein
MNKPVSQTTGHETVKQRAHENRGYAIRSKGAEIALLRCLVRDCQNDIAAWMPPDSGLSDQEVIRKLLVRLDGPQGREAMGDGE